MRFITMKLWIALFIICSFRLVADTGCIHVSYCRLIQDVAPDSKIVNLLPANFNPHHFNPDITVTKKLTTTSELLLPPTDFFFAAKLILKKRDSLNENKTFQFESKIKGNSYTHFWFYPEVYCSFLEQAQVKLASWGHKVDGTVAKQKCEELKTLVGELKSELTKKSGWTFVIDHELLSPYLSEQHFTTLNLHNVSEGGEFITPFQIKFLEKLKATKAKTIWITTEEFSIKGLDKYKKNEYTYEINLTNIDKELLNKDALAYTKYLLAELKKI